MRLVAFLLAILLFQAWTSVLCAQEKRITLEMQNEPLEKVLNEIEQRSDYHFLYNNKLVDVDQKVTVRVKNRTVTSALPEVFARTGIAYEISGKQIVLRPVGAKKASVGQPADVAKDGRSISGVVYDVSGLPVIGASILLKGTSNGAVTDMDGAFVLNNVSADDVLEISYIGYETQEVPVGQQNNLRVTLEENAEMLDEVVVVGFGTQKKVNLTGSVSSVRMADALGDRPIVNAAAALQGVVPGLRIESSTGTPGDDMTYNIRGTTSINGGSP